MTDSRYAYSKNIHRKLHETTQGLGIPFNSIVAVENSCKSREKSASEAHQWVAATVTKDAGKFKLAICALTSIYAERLHSNPRDWTPIADGAIAAGLAAIVCTVGASQKSETLPNLLSDI